jgi:hypothetical protein
VAEPEARQMELKPLLVRCARLRVALGVRHGEQAPEPRNAL